MLVWFIYVLNDIMIIIFILYILGLKLINYIMNINYKCTKTT